MEKGFIMRDGENGFERAIGILEMIGKLTDVTNEEVDGAADFVFPELQSTVLGVLEDRKNGFIQEEAQGREYRLPHGEGQNPPNLLFNA